MSLSSISGYSANAISAASPRSLRAQSGNGLLTANPKIGSGRPVKMTGTQINFYKLLLAKNGFVEVPASALPEKARLEMARKLGPNQAVSFYMNPATGAFSALTQNERNPNEVSLYRWNSGNETWVSSLV